MKTKHTHLIIIACCTLLAAVGCKPKPIGMSDIQSISGDRHIHVRAEGGAWVGPGEDKFTVKLTGHEVVIDRERVLVDKTIHAPVPAGTKKFEVIFDGVGLTVKGDGAMIMETPFNK